MEASPGRGVAGHQRSPRAWACRRRWSPSGRRTGSA